MSEPKVLEVSATEKPELEKGESGLSEANVGTEARESVSAEEKNVGINLTDQKGTPTGNTEKRGLSMSNEKRGMTYVNDTNVQTNQPRVLSKKKNIVNTITVNEVKKLIKLLGGSTSGKIGFDALVVEELPDVGESGVIYLIENQGEAPNVYDEYIWIESEAEFEMIGTTEVDLTDYYTKEESDAKFVDLDTNQTISGIKTLLSALNFENNNFSIFKDGSTIKFKVNKNLVLTLGYSSSAIGSLSLRPQSDNGGDLGQTNVRWKDFYLAGKIKDGTNEWDYNSIGFPVISAPASTTLTADEVNAISKGAVIIGSSSNKFLGYEKIVFFPLGDTSFGENGGFAFCVNGFNPEVRAYRINNSNVISIQDLTAPRIRLQSIQQINGKMLPVYPSSTGTWVLKCVNGTLTWVQE